MTTDQMIEEALMRFKSLFVKEVVKDVDTSNSIVLPLWKDNHSHLSREISEFIKQELQTIASKSAEEVGKLKKELRTAKGPGGSIDVPDNMYNWHRKTYNQAINDVLKILGEEK